MLVMWLQRYVLLHLRVALMTSNPYISSFAVGKEHQPAPIHNQDRRKRHPITNLCLEFWSKTFSIRARIEFVDLDKGAGGISPRMLHIAGTSPTRSSDVYGMAGAILAVDVAQVAYRDILIDVCWLLSGYERAWAIF